MSSRRALAVLALAASAFGQGRGQYLNFESPQVRPITVARVTGHDYVVACNTPDNAVEIYDTIGMRLVRRVRVGLEPVSVVYNATLGRVYSLNMVGDSISVIRLSAKSATAPLSVAFERTVRVGDEPMMLAFHPDQRSVFVTLNSRYAIAWLDATTLQPVVPGAEWIPLVDGLKPTKAIKEPRAILVRGNQLLVLGFRGGHTYVHDYDLWAFDLNKGQWSELGGLGTFKANMAFASNGDLWVVGGEAQNQLSGRPAVKAAPSGFVTSLLHKITGAGTSAAKTVTRDLDLDQNGQPVAKTAALAHPMDVALLEDNGRVAKVFVAAMHSDRVGVIEPKTVDPKAWTVRAIDVTAARAGSMAGPRGLALKRAITGLANDPGDRLYVLNRVDNSIAVIDPATEKQLQVTLLSNDPTPDYIRTGRRLLYSAKLSGSGFVSCASCHIDGHTDGNAWDLSEPATAKPVPLRTELIDGVTDSVILGMTHWPNHKGFMVTQSLQGLVNWETEPLSQSLFTNAPYHWRADTDFKSFNGAFVEVQGMTNLAGPGQPERGVTEAEMRNFEDFVNSISYPPNPEQPLDRRYSGSLGDVDKEDGFGALRGLKLFHQKRLVNPVLAGRSCVQCHALPEGSNNRITRIGVSTPQPVETAALRGLAQKEARLETDARTTNPIATSDFGLEHQGTLRSINDFNLFVFGHDFAANEKSELDDLTRFVRQFDTGVAPLVGFPFQVDTGNVTNAGTGFVLDIFERQVSEANIGLAAVARLGGKARGFYFRPDTGSTGWIEEPGSTTYSRAQLLAQVRTSDDVIVFQATPLGNDHRVAAPSGRAMIRRGPAPSAIELRPMLPSTAWRDVPKLRHNWVPGTGPSDFLWSGVYSGTQTKVPEPPFLRALRLLQYGLVQDGPTLGLPYLRHDAPRRFRVAVRNARPGARLILLVPDDATKAPPYTTPRPVIPIIVPLYPTGVKTATGVPVWESAVEAEPLLYYTLMLGGPSAPNVKSALQNKLSEPPTKGSFHPSTWNKHWVWIANEDGTFASGGWQALTIG